ncbi:type III secretion system translocator chaperone SicA [Chromobacterium piscinae]|uniref:Type III secretion system translocator chaperone SicA n=1 Tax=Chromobacterium piscinae TaxID=686831 RepID=A0ABV0H9N0_9NEIS
MTSHDENDDQVVQQVWDAVEQGATLKDVYGVPDDIMQGLYALAYDHYQRRQLDEAEKIFRFICVYDFYNVDYMLGLGAVMHCKGEYKQAIDYYAVAFSIGKNDYRPMFYIGQCQLAMRHPKLARKSFEFVVRSCSDQALCDKAQVYLDTLRNNVSASTLQEERGEEKSV